MTKHTERCKLCKDRVFDLLKIIFKDVEKNHNLGLSARLDDYKDSVHYKSLSRIYKALQESRGNKDLVFSAHLSRADFFLVNRKGIVEFDESQHFTAQRKFALELYPSDLKLGFDRKRWIALCEQLDKHDDSPKYRDEQRAWYDVLKDFAASIMDIDPTVRLYASDYKWCDLNMDDKNILEIFKKVIGHDQ